MNNQCQKTNKTAWRALRLAAVIGCVAFAAPNFAAQQKTDVSQVKNQASATYSDGTHGFSTVSDDKNTNAASLKSDSLFKNSLGVCSDAKSGDMLKGSQFLPRN